MPEGHTIHALARDLTTAFAGTRPSVSSPQGRFVEGAALLDGQEVEAASAWGKHLFLDFTDERSLHVHLGLIGKFEIAALDGAPAPAPVGAVRVRLETPDWLAQLRGAIICTVLDPEEVATVVSAQGPDPLRDDADPELAWARIHRSGRTIAELLMDQSILAGVGNVYRCEVLWRHRLHPLKPGRVLKRSSWDAIWADLVRLLPLGVRSGVIVTLDDLVARVEDAPGAGGVVVPRRYAVYKRTGEPCLRCGARIRTRVVAGRNLFWCGNCQRRT